MTEGAYCSGGHRFFCAGKETVDNDTSGMVYVFIVCTSCGEGRVNTHKIEKGK